MNKYIGVLGANGKIGNNVLDNITGVPILAGVRDLDKLEEGRYEKIEVNIENRSELVDFCGRCNTVINCTGNARKYGGIVASVCLELNANYIDVSGDEYLVKCLKRMEREFRNKNLCCIHSVGVSPGLTEVLMYYLLRDNPDYKVEMYFCGNGQLSLTAAIDMLWSCTSKENNSMSYITLGHIQQASTFMLKKQFCEDIGELYCIPIITSNMLKCAKQFTTNSIFFYNTFKSEDTMMCLITAKNIQDDCMDEQAHKLVKCFEKDFKSMKELTALYIFATNGTCFYDKTYHFLFEGNWNELTGIIAAITGQLIIRSNNIKCGVGEIWNSFEVSEFIAELLNNERIKVIV